MERIWVRYERLLEADFLYCGAALAAFAGFSQSQRRNGQNSIPESSPNEGQKQLQMVYIIPPLVFQYPSGVYRHQKPNV